MPTTDAETLVASLTARGITLTMAGNRLRVVPWKNVADDERATLKRLREEVKALVRARDVPPKPAPPPEDVACLAEVTPAVYARGRRLVTEADVREALIGLGDEVVADYNAGRLSKARAFALTRTWLNQRRELGC